MPAITAAPPAAAGYVIGRNDAISCIIVAIVIKLFWCATAFGQRSIVSNLDLSGTFTKTHRPSITIGEKHGEEIIVKKLTAVLIGAVILSTVVSSVSDPAFALGGCGVNRHRGPFGGCRWGGQRQNWCLRHTGHGSVRVGGARFC